VGIVYSDTSAKSSREALFDHPHPTYPRIFGGAQQRPPLDWRNAG
jgi:hypothetical protein